jgi:hypothetical protein
VKRRAICGECGFDASGDHSVCARMFQERQADWFADRDSNPDRVLSAAQGRIALERIALLERPFEEW